MTDRKTDYGWFAVLGDDGEWANPEPGEIVHIKGKRMVYTCGCADPFDWTGSVTHDGITYLGRCTHPNFGLIGKPSGPRGNPLDAHRDAPARWASHGWRGSR